MHPARTERIHIYTHTDRVSIRRIARRALSHARVLRRAFCEWRRYFATRVYTERAVHGAKLSTGNARETRTRDPVVQRRNAQGRVITSIAFAGDDKFAPARSRSVVARKSVTRARARARAEYAIRLGEIPETVSYFPNETLAISNRITVRPRDWT